MVDRRSLLWPGRAAIPLLRSDFAVAIALYVAAAALRFLLLDANPYTAEASHFAVSRSLWENPGTIRSLHDHLPPDDFSWFFWQRPLLALLYAPSAEVSFTAYRIHHILVTAAIPAVAFLLLRQLGTRRPFALAAGVILAAHPGLLVWNVLVLPDATVALLTLSGLLAAHRGRPIVMAILLLMAAWVKEVAFVTALALLVLALLREADGTRSRLWPIELGRFGTALCAVLVLAFVPLAISLLLPGARFPGFRPGIDLAGDLERLFLLLWLAPLPFIGLMRPATRRLAVVALAWPAFFVTYTLVSGKAVEAWYHFVPATMTVVAAAATLSASMEEVPAPRRWATPAAALLLAALLVVPVAWPDQAAANQAIATPLSHRGHWNLEQTLDAELSRDDDLRRLMASVPDDRREAWLVVDLDWSIVMHPVDANAGTIFKEYSPGFPLADKDLDGWVAAIEDRANATLFFRTASPLSTALASAWPACTTLDGNYGLILVNDECKGRGEAFRAAYRQADV